MHASNPKIYRSIFFIGIFVSVLGMQSCDRRHKSSSISNKQNFDLLATSLFDMQLVEQDTVTYSEEGLFGNFKLKSNHSFSYLEDGEYHFLIDITLPLNSNLQWKLISTKNPLDAINVEFSHSPSGHQIKIFDTAIPLDLKLKTKEESYFMKFVFQVQDRNFQLEISEEISQENLFNSQKIPIAFDTDTKDVFIELEVANAGISLFKHFKHSTLEASKTPKHDTRVETKSFEVAHLVSSKEILLKKFSVLNLTNSNIIDIVTWMDASYVYSKLQYSFSESTSSSIKIESLAIACHFHGEKFACHKKDPKSLVPSFDIELDTSIFPEEPTLELEDLTNLENLER